MKHKDWEIVFNSISDPLMVLSPDYRILAVNTATLKACNVPEDRLINSICHEIFHELNVPPGTCPLKKLKESRQQESVETETRIFNGTYGITVSPVFDGDGKLSKVVHIARNIEKRKKIESALWESEERFRTLIEQSPVSIQIMDPEGFTLKVNRAWENLWGVRIEDIRGYNMLQDRQLEELNIMQYIRKGFSGEESFIPAAEYNVQKTLGKGSKRWVQAHIYPVKNENGEILTVVLMHEDITDRKHAEDELKERVKELQEFYEMSVGRELKMKKLKDEIDKLQLKLSRHEK